MCPVNFPARAVEAPGVRTPRSGRRSGDRSHGFSRGPPATGREGPLPVLPEASCVGRGDRGGYLPGDSSAGRVRDAGVPSSEFRSPKSAGQEAGSAGRTQASAARFSAGPLLISARGGGVGEVSGEGSRPLGRGADGSGPRGYPACRLPAPPEIWGGGGESCGSG